MLSIIRDVAIPGLRETHALDCSLTLQENIAAHLDSGHSCHLYINGEYVADPSGDDRLQRLATVLDTVTVIRRPEAFNVIAAVVIAIVAAIAVIALTPKPRIPNDMGVGKDSPNNKLTGQSNIARAYQAIPDVYGEVRCYPDLIQQSTTEYINQIKYVTEWLCVSRGIGTVSDIKFAETPIGNIAGASYEIFYPVAPVGGFAENGTTTVNGVIESFASEEVNGQEFPPAVPYPLRNEPAATVTVTPSGTSFTVTVTDGAQWDQLKGIFPGGTAKVKFVYQITGPSNITYDANSTCTSFVDNGATVTFTFAAASAFPADATVTNPQSVDITPIGSSFTVIGPFTLPVTSDRLRWNTVFPRGLKGTVSITAEWWKIDSGGVEIPATRQSQAFSFGADTYDARYYTTEVTPTAGNGNYRIQFTRTTAQIGDQGTDLAKIEELYAIRFYATKSYQGVVIIRVTTQATLEATGFQERKFNLKFVRHVRGLTSTTVSASRNFARAVAHIYSVIAGRSIAELDTTSLQAINTKHGETNELLRFDFTFDDKDVSLGDRLRAACNAARVIDSRVGPQWTFLRDELRTLGPTWQFDYRNLTADGNSTVTLRGSLPSSYDGVKLEYVDPIKNKKAFINLRIESNGNIVVGVSANPYEVQLAGCRTVSQANNRAYFEAAKIKYQRRAVSDTTFGDALTLVRGELVRWVDPNDFYADDGIQSGEVLSISGNTIETDAPILFGTQTSGRVVFTGADGLSTSSIVATPRTDGKNGFVLASAPPATIYVRDSTTKQLGSRFSFGAGLTDAQIQDAGLYLLTDKKPNSDGTIGIELSQYDDRMYQFD